MQRIIFDTSVYGKMIFDERVLLNVRNKIQSHEFLVYGTSIIRKELRATPKSIRKGSQKIRILLLNLYDSFIVKDNQNLKSNKLVEDLSGDYFLEYKKNGGALSNDAIANDLMIVATATIYHLDIIISDDERTMLSDKAVKSYTNVNKRYGLDNPIFKKYAQFIRELTR